MALTVKRKHDHLYKKKAWRSRRAELLKKEPLCRECYNSTPRRLTAATIADHIDPTWEDSKDVELAFNSVAIQPICRYHHDRKTWERDIRARLIKKKTEIKFYE